MADHFIPVGGHSFVRKEEVYISLIKIDDVAAEWSSGKNAGLLR